MITCVMNTYGDHPRLAEEAIEGFLRQDYPDIKLLIVNTNIRPVYFTRGYPNIEVQNFPPDKFKSYPEKFAYSLCQVKTSHFILFDDDDISLPWRVSALPNATVPSPPPGPLLNTSMKPRKPPLPISPSFARYPASVFYNSTRPPCAAWKSNKLSVIIKRPVHSLTVSIRPPARWERAACGSTGRRPARSRCGG